MFYDRDAYQRQKLNFYRFGKVMIDLETLSTKTNASIMSIAAVEFNKFSGESFNTLYIKIDPSEWGKNGRDVDGNTVKWWLEQEKDATQSLLEKPFDGYATLKSALERLSKFIEACDNTLIEEGETKIETFNPWSGETEVFIIPKDDEKRRVTVWGNGATMDITILQSAYEYFGMKTPWQYWAVNDVRTIVDFKPEIKANTEFEGVKHYPIDDCKHQIKYLSETIKELGIYV